MDRLSRSGPWCGYARWVLLVLLPAMLLCVVPAAIGQHYTFANYGPEAGLANVNLTALLESRSGIIWAGTQKGVFTANGSRFEAQDAFTAAGIEGVWSMSEDNEGRMWAVDGSHLAYWARGRVQAVQGIKLHILSVSGVALVRVPDEPGAIYLLHDQVLERIASTDQGRSWQQSEAFPPALLVQHPKLRQLSSIAQGRGSTVWAGCAKAICRIDLAKGTVREFGPSEGVDAKSWANFLLTRSGEVWARGDRTVERLPVGGDHFSAVAGLPKGSSESTTQTILLEDRDGRVVMNVDEGIVRTDGIKWQILNQKNGLPQDEIEVMTFDHTGALWLSPSGRGVSRWLGYGDWEGWTKDDGLSSNIVLAVAEDQAGTKWIATQGGLDRMDAGTGRVSKLNNPLLHQLTSAAAVSGHVWTGDSLGQVMDFEPATGKTRIRLKDLETVYQLLADKEGRIWVCSPKGLDYFSPADRWSMPHHIGQPQVPSGNAYGISQGVAGVLWVMTEKGMYRLDHGEWAAVPIPVKAGGFYNLMAAAAADGTLWVQSRHPTKIVHLKVVGQTASTLSEFTDPLMESENLGFMGLDHRGWLWIESDRGLHVFNGKQWVRSNTQDGLLYDNADYPAFLADSDGSIWMGTSGGLAHLIHPEAVFKVPRPAVQLSNVNLGGSELHEGASNDFDLRRPPLSVRLLSTDYNRAGAIVYRYHLDGLESAGQETEDSNLRFPALAPGNYTLKVAAYDRRLHESSLERSISFRVLEPWWNRVWFQLIEFVVCAIVMLGLWRLSVHLLVMRQRELKAMVAERTRELEQEKADLIGARSALIEMTRRDGLTGLLNRAAIFDLMSRLCEDSLATGSTLAIVMADIDHFKRINDEYGHVMGDAAIRECASRIAKTIRPADYVGRYGGEELLILMPGLDPASSTLRMEELRTSVANEPIHCGAVELSLTCSFGVAWMGTQRCALEALVGVADEALYAAKKNGRNRVEFAKSELAAMN